MSGAGGVGRIALFGLKFAILSACLLYLWWWKVQPQYVGLIGRIAGWILHNFSSVPIVGMKVEVDPSGVLSTETSLVFLAEGRRYPIDVAYLVANIPPYIALVLATPGLAFKRIWRALLIGLAILATGHILFLVLMFMFSGQAQESPEIPTALGLFLLTMPFVLWIALAYWDKVKLLFDEPEEPGTEQPDAAQPSDASGD